jgi:hypothetical protein
MDPINLEVHWPDADGNDAMWTLNVQSLDTEEAMLMEMYSDTKPLALIGSLVSKPTDLSTKDLQCVMWLLKRRAGERFPVEQTPKFDLFAFIQAIQDAAIAFGDKVTDTKAKENAERAARSLPPKGPTPRTRARKVTSANP